MSTFYDLGFISSMCKILWKKWLKYFCWSDEASDRSWDDSESDTPDHSTRAGLGWDGLGWTLTRRYPQFFICRYCIRMFTKLCLACPCPLSTLLSAISSPGSWLMISFISPSSVSHLCPGPLLPPDLHLRHWLGDMGAGGQLLHSPLFYI